MRFSATIVIRPSSRLRKLLTEIFAGVRVIDQYWTPHSPLIGIIYAATQRPMAAAAAAWRMAMASLEDVQ